MTNRTDSIETSSRGATTDELSKRLEAYFDRLWPICRSIMGAGFRDSLTILDELMPCERLHFSTGTHVFDWVIPKEWTVRDAYVIDPNGRRRLAFRESNLHLLNYSAPFRGRLGLSELKGHLYSLPSRPDAIPYLTTYYKERWGFCLTHRELQSLPEGEYGVVVDTQLAPGTLDIAEVVLPGETEDEVLFSSYLCHPSLANNEICGPLLMAFLYERLAKRTHRRLRYRFVLSAETIGTIAYLSIRGQHLKNHLVAGYVVTCVGDGGPFTLKRSRAANTLADRAALAALVGEPHSVCDFDPANGSDERQYCSPGFNLPVASLMRTMYGCYPEYHTGLDDKSIVSFPGMAHTLDVYTTLVDCLESNVRYRRVDPHCEPQLGRRGLYPSLGSQMEIEEKLRTTLWFLNLADGEHDLLAIAERSGIPFRDIALAARTALDVGLVERSD
jgi:aminopeptidase-like protein